MKALVDAFNQEKALVGAFSMIVQLHRLIAYSTTLYSCSVILIVGRDQTSWGLRCIWSCVLCAVLQYCRDPAVQWMMLQVRSRCHHGPTSNGVKLSLQLDNRYSKSVQWVTIKSISCCWLLITFRSQVGTDDSLGYFYVLKVWSSDCIACRQQWSSAAVNCINGF